MDNHWERIFLYGILFSTVTPSKNARHKARAHCDLVHALHITLSSCNV